MKATLFRGEDVSEETFEAILQLLQAITGMNQFVGNGGPIPLPNKSVMPWSDLFDMAQGLRTKHQMRINPKD